MYPFPIAKPETKTEILYATDFSEPSRRAFACAKEIARRRGAFLRSIHIIDLSAQEVRQHISFQAALGEAHRTLRLLRRELRLGGIKEAATVITAGTCAQAIRDAALRYHSSLLIMGLHGEPGLTVPVFGGTVRRIIRNPPCPVLTVGMLGPATQKNGLKRVLLVTDRDPESLKAVEKAWPVEAHGLAAAHFAVLSPDAPMDAGTAFDGKDHDVPLHPLAYSEAAKAILAKADELQANLIVLGMQAGEYLDSMAVESVARAVITKAPCPVMTVRTGGEDRPMHFGRRTLTTADVHSAFGHSKSPIARA